MVYNEEQSDSTGTKLLGSLLNALLFVAMMIVVTVVFVFLYKYRCLKVFLMYFRVSMLVHVHCLLCVYLCLPVLEARAHCFSVFFAALSLSLSLCYLSSFFG
jgi:hypothetical protein